MGRTSAFLVWRSGRWSRTTNAFSDLSADLAIEIVSANDLYDSLGRKRTRYRTCGTSEVWIVSPRPREALVYSDRGVRLLHETDELSTELIPGFRMLVSDLFASKK
jgi:Uma2 family endonuclease